MDKLEPIFGDRSEEIVYVLTDIYKKKYNIMFDITNKKIQQLAEIFIIDNINKIVNNEIWIKNIISSDNLYETLDNPFDEVTWQTEIEEEKKRKNIYTGQEPNTNFVCKKCGEKAIFKYEIQTRGADEATTQFYNCLKCDFTWRK